MSLVDGYEPRWDITALDGEQGALFTKWARDAIRDGSSVEVKTDLESWRTGNIYIEFQCHVSGRWTASGIDERHTQAVLWAHLVVGPMVLFAPTDYVRWVARKYGKPRECMRGSHPTRGQVMPIPQFVAALVGVATHRASAVPALPELDRAAPFGVDSSGRVLAPYGLNKDGAVRLQPGGRRAQQRGPPALPPGALVRMLTQIRGESSRQTQSISFTYGSARRTVRNSIAHPKRIKDVAPQNGANHTGGV